MKGHAKAFVAFAVAVAIAGAGYWLWSAMFSQRAQIDAMHRACVAEFTSGADKAMADRSKPAGAKPADPGAAIAKGISDAFAKIIAGMAGSLSDAVCGTIREACESDFEGRICLAARERYGR